MSDLAAAPANSASPIVSPTVAELLAAHGTLRRGPFARFYAPRGLDSVAEIHVLAAVAAGGAFASQVGGDGALLAVTAAPGRPVTPATVGTADAGTEN